MLRKPGQIGAVAPSSPSLAGVIASVVPTAGGPVVVELGPGTGAVTTAIDARLDPGARHLAVELDPRMAGFLRQAIPGWRSSRAMRRSCSRCSRSAASSTPTPS